MKRTEFTVDEMTPVERARALARGERIDRLPCSPSLGEQPTRLIGVTVSQYLNAPKIMAEAQVAAFRLYGQDGVGVGPDQFGILEALGAKMRYWPDTLPSVAEPLVKEPEDLDKLAVIDPRIDGRLPLYLEALEILQDRLGHLVKVGTGIGGPFTTAALLRGQANFLRDVKRNPELAHRLLAFATENILSYLEVCWEKGFTSSIGDPFASNDVLGPWHFREFVFPYLKKIGDWFKAKTGKGYSLHICGKTRLSWQDIAETGAASFSLDNVEDLAEAKQAIGHRVALKGNVAPVEVMLEGGPAEVMAAARQCILKAYDNPKGFVLGTGCRVALNTKPENIIALMDAARHYSKCLHVGDGSHE